MSLSISYEKAIVMTVFEIALTLIRSSYWELDELKFYRFVHEKVEIVSFVKKSRRKVGIIKNKINVNQLT